jgi:hypothetical protein
MVLPINAGSGVVARRSTSDWLWLSIAHHLKPRQNALGKGGGGWYTDYQSHNLVYASATLSSLGIPCDGICARLSKEGRRMRPGVLALLLASVVVTTPMAPASATGTDAVAAVPLRAPASHRFAGAGAETLWIFDADFSTLTGDNAGWVAYDRSGTIAQANYWHHDTIRINGFEHLGDSTWWCGAYDDYGCWRQSRGYGNDWIQMLERHFTEAVDSLGVMMLEYDQRYAIERNYDYGYVDVRSPTHPDSWHTVVTVHNPGFYGTPGSSQDWDDTNPLGPGHMSVDMSDYVGDWFDLRFRFESDFAYSSQDQYDNPPASSCLDGAWQLDNITLTVNGHTVYYDDAESYGDNGWVHEDQAACGQTGVTFWRGQYGIDFVTGRGFTCDDRPFGSWMYAPVDPFTSTMVDGEHAWLMSPPIDIRGADRLVGHLDGWTDTGDQTHDAFNLFLASSDAWQCVTDPAGFIDESPGWWVLSTGQWWSEFDDWDAFAGRDWLAVLWVVVNTAPAEDPHMGGLYINRQRVGVPSGDPGTKWEIHSSRRFDDWFQDNLTQALADHEAVMITDRDGIASARMQASNDGGLTWESYDMQPESAGSNWWVAPAPASQMTPGSEIRYYYEAVDGIGRVSVFPNCAPDLTLEMSILPIAGSIGDPAILLVDKFAGGTAGAGRSRPPYLLDPLDPAVNTELYYREMLQALGHEFDVYDVIGYGPGAFGPDTVGMKYYDTQIWITGFLDDTNTNSTISRRDQNNLVHWLNESSEGRERNLLLSGDNIGRELVGGEGETLNFYWGWMASEFISGAVGVVTVDSVPGLEDHAGDHAFLTHDDGECIVRGACPKLRYFDVLQPAAGSVGAEVIVDYVKMDATRWPAGVAYTNPTMGYRTVNLGFGMECMMDGTWDGGAGNYTPEGYYHNGVADRVNLMQNIMEYFEKEPGGSATDVPEEERINALSHAYPNPLAVSAVISYAVKDGGQTTIRVYNVAGKVVRTLLDRELAAGTSGRVVWDGTDDAGERCAAGVYFYRILATGFSSSGKMVLLR